MKEYCYKEAKEQGKRASYCYGIACHNYPCEARKESDNAVQLPACRGDIRCSPKKCKNWKNCEWNSYRR